MHHMRPPRPVVHGCLSRVSFVYRRSFHVHDKFKMYANWTPPNTHIPIVTSRSNPHFQLASYILGLVLSACASAMRATWTNNTYSPPAGIVMFLQVSS